jgi:hypothetical protein
LPPTSHAGAGSPGSYTDRGAFLSAVEFQVTLSDSQAAEIPQSLANDSRIDNYQIPPNHRSPAESWRNTSSLKGGRTNNRARKLV